MKHLSRFDIEAIADKYVQAYMALPDVRNTQIYRIDPELLLEKVLGLNVEYQHLSYDGSILGMTSFTEMGVQVFEDDDNEAFFFLDGKTVLVEKDLNFDSKLKGRKNFTLMHEGSHQIFKMLFPNDYGVTQKSARVHYYKANSERNKPISDWEEWQANTLGAAILLPENLIKQGMYLFSLGEKIEYRNNDKYEKRAKRTIDVYGYEDDISEQFHRELITPFVDPFEQAEEERIEEEKEQLRQLEIAKVRKVLEMLKPVQRERLIKAILLGMSSRKIAKEEGVYYSVVDKSIAAARKNFKKFYENL